MKHGEFKAWVKENCTCSYDNAVRYMRVATQWEGKMSHGTFSDLADISIREFLGRKENPKPAPNATLTSRQVQKVKKLYALATSTANEEEADTAQQKRLAGEPFD